MNAVFSFSAWIRFPAFAFSHRYCQNAVPLRKKKKTIAAAPAQKLRNIR